MYIERNTIRLALALAGAGRTLAAIHRIASANRYTPPKFHSVAFDDETNELTLVKTIDSNNSHVWISLNHDKSEIYGSSMDNGRLSSYDAATLELTGIVQTSGACLGQNSAFNVATRTEPYYVISGSYGSRNGCAMSIAVTDNGSFDDMSQSWRYEAVSSAHGLAIQEVNGTELLYTADMGANVIWVHAIDKSGNVEELQRAELEGAGLKPRHLIIHPQGTYAYVTLEATNSLLALKLDEAGLVDEGGESSQFQVLEEGTSNANYWSAGVSLSVNKRYLWFTTRGRAGTSGLISCFLLDEHGSVVSKMFTLETGTSNTISSSVTAAPWSDEHAILTDAPGAYIEVWKLDEPLEATDGDVLEYATAKENPEAVRMSNLVDASLRAPEDRAMRCEHHEDGNPAHKLYEAYLHWAANGMTRCETIGYAARASSAMEEEGCWQLGPYIIETTLILIAPAFMAASIYMILGRIILLTDGERHAMIRKKWLTMTFVAGDVLSLLLQSSAFVYVFDATLMILVLGWMNWFHPGEIGLLLRGGPAGKNGLELMYKTGRSKIDDQSSAWREDV
ncbi:unnamed protein product [Parascedosporium putredinis]|uniref:Uncharacterized protein n=1 Tax=Parascedosporium putredinis TaxID=1442378 RepID=A0A9P1H188_9PEZI|nr:unnamed protein product [Parascedosporium putredinis]CAI7993521.1 unnamed protein product [Parascedosporium putredinis]